MSWSPGSFAILASASEPSWYVQFADAPNGFVVEVSYPAHNQGSPFRPEQLRMITELGFGPTDVNFQQ
jgi:hypothetical protein